MQKHPDVTPDLPFLYLDDNKKMKLFPFLYMYKEAPNPDKPIPLTEVPCVSTGIEFPMKKWVHIGCEVFGLLSVLCFPTLCFLYYTSYRDLIS